MYFRGWRWRWKERQEDDKQIDSVSAAICPTLALGTHTKIIISSIIPILRRKIMLFTSAYNWHSGMQEAEEDGHHRRLGPLCQDQAVGLKGKENREEKEDNDQEREPQSILQRILCICRWGDVIAKGKVISFPNTHISHTIMCRLTWRWLFWTMIESAGQTRLARSYKIEVDGSNSWCDDWKHGDDDDY